MEIGNYKSHRAYRTWANCSGLTRVTVLVAVLALIIAAFIGILQINERFLRTQATVLKPSITVTTLPLPQQPGGAKCPTTACPQWLGNSYGGDRAKVPYCPDQYGRCYCSYSDRQESQTNCGVTTTATIRDWSQHVCINWSTGIDDKVVWSAPEIINIQHSGTDTCAQEQQAAADAAAIAQRDLAQQCGGKLNDLELICGHGKVKSCEQRTDQGTCVVAHDSYGNICGTFGSDCYKYSDITRCSSNERAVPVGAYSYACELIPTSSTNTGSSTSSTTNSGGGPSTPTSNTSTTTPSDPAMIALQQQLAQLQQQLANQQSSQQNTSTSSNSGANTSQQNTSTSYTSGSNSTSSQSNSQGSYTYQTSSNQSQQYTIQYLDICSDTPGLEAVTTEFISTFRLVYGGDPTCDQYRFWVKVVEAKKITNITILQQAMLYHRMYGLGTDEASFNKVLAYLSGAATTTSNTSQYTGNTSTTNTYTGTTTTQNTTNNNDSEAARIRSEILRTQQLIAQLQAQKNSTASSSQSSEIARLQSQLAQLQAQAQYTRPTPTMNVNNLFATAFPTPVPTTDFNSLFGSPYPLYTGSTSSNTSIAYTYSPITGTTLTEPTRLTVPTPTPLVIANAKFTREQVTTMFTKVYKRAPSDTEIEYWYKRLAKKWTKTGSYITLWWHKVWKIKH